MSSKLVSDSGDGQEVYALYETQQEAIDQALHNISFGNVPKHVLDEFGVVAMAWSPTGDQLTGQELADYANKLRNQR